MGIMNQVEEQKQPKNCIALASVSVLGLAEDTKARRPSKPGNNSGSHQSGHGPNQKPGYNKPELGDVKPGVGSTEPWVTTLIVVACVLLFLLLIYLIYLGVRARRKREKLRTQQEEEQEKRNKMNKMQKVCSHGLELVVEVTQAE